MATTAEKIEPRPAPANVRMLGKIDVGVIRTDSTSLENIPQGHYQHVAFGAADISQREAGYFIGGHRLCHAGTISATLPLDPANPLVGGQGVEFVYDCTGLQKVMVQKGIYRVSEPEPGHCQFPATNMNTDLRPRRFVCLVGGFNQTQAPLSFVSNDVFEQAYGRLGRVRGHAASAEVRQRDRQLWCGNGDYAAVWLLNRLEGETSVDTLDASAAILRSMSRSVIPHVLSAIAKAPSIEILEALIRGLRRDALVQDSGADYSNVVAAIRAATSHTANEVREAAYETALKLSVEDAADILGDAKVREPVAELIELIEELEEELARSGSAGI